MVVCTAFMAQIKTAHTFLCVDSVEVQLGKWYAFSACQQGMTAGGIASILFPRGHDPQTSFCSLFILLKYDWLTLELKMNTLCNWIDKNWDKTRGYNFFKGINKLAPVLVARKECQNIQSFVTDIWNQWYCMLFDEPQGDSIPERGVWTKESVE